jgi:hypothetical protein
MKTEWYRRSGERVSAKRVSEVHAHAVHAKRYGYPKSPYAPPGMSAQPNVADALERMTDGEWATYSGTYTYRRVDK